MTTPLGPTDLSQLPSVKLQSPLAVIGAFIYLVRERFNPRYGLQWQWQSDVTTTDIVIEAQYNQNTEERDARPGIYIDKDQTSYGKVSTGHLDHDQPRILERDLEHRISFGQTDIVIDCISPSRGESMYLADVVQSYLEASKYVIMAVFGFRDISPIVCGRTQAFSKQTDLHQTTLTFRVEYETRWKTAPAANVMAGLQLHLSQRADEGPNKVLADIYLNSNT